MAHLMQPGMVYEFPLWRVALLLVNLAALGGALLPLAVRQVLSAELRHSHNAAAAAIFSVIGVTFGVLLAFVAMLAWDGFNKAKAASYAEAAAVMDVYNAAIGFADPQLSAMREDIAGYLDAVIGVEWPAQAAGHTADAGALSTGSRPVSSPRASPTAICRYCCCNRSRGSGMHETRDCWRPRPQSPRSSGS
jgi:hypothetical protein